MFGQKFNVYVSADKEDLGKFGQYHEDSWSKEIPTDSELTSSLMNEIKSWLFELGFDITVEVDSE